MKGGRSRLKRKPFLASFSKLYFISFFRLPLFFSVASERCRR